jgi:hypothetical protein
MLAVVENEQKFLPPKRVDQRFHQGSPGLFADAQHGRDGPGQARRLRDDGQLDEPDAASK